MPRPLEPGRDLTLGQVARLGRLSGHTVRKAAAKGLLKGYVLPSGGGHRRFEPVEVVRFLERHGVPVPAELRALAGAARP